VRVCCAVNE
jgi:Na+/glutamate symporter